LESNSIQKIKKKKQGKRPPRGAARRNKKFPCSFELKLKAVKLYLDEEYTAEFVAEEVGVSDSTIYAWAKAYRTQGEDGLRPQPHPRRKNRIPKAVRDKAISLKQEEPTRGVKKISQLLRRFFFMSASPETVRKTLHEESLIEKPKKKPKRNPARPRFFERSTPNQMWMTDIFTFRLGGKNAYLIGYIDDYSRYITGLGLFRSQTAEHVIDTYRTAIAEYKPPKEMLTDNGRQYTNWRGTTKFEKEIHKDRLKHIKSSPHHPQTLGKIERFWETIFKEFLSRVQFTSFEEARERLALWVRYYNHKRPHQGIGGLCPADRYFEIQHELKDVLEKGIQENILEMALRGKPKDPFYMVGRMDGQSVVIRAEKGKVKMSIDGEDDGNNKEIEYNIKEDRDEKEQETPAESHGRTEVPGRTLDLDGKAQARRDLQGAGRQLDHAEQLAGPGIGRDAPGVGTPDQFGPGTIPEPEAAITAGETQGTSTETDAQINGPEAGRPVEPHTGREENGKASKLDRRCDGRKKGFDCTEAGRSYHGCPERADDCNRSSLDPRYFPEDILSMGETLSGGSPGGGYRPEARASQTGSPFGRGSGSSQDQEVGIRESGPGSPAPYSGDHQSDRRSCELLG
jgi:transposase InsO family protein